MTDHPDTLAADDPMDLNDLVPELRRIAKLHREKNRYIATSWRMLQAADYIEHLEAALAAHDQREPAERHGKPLVIDVDGCGTCGRWVSYHFMVDPSSVIQEERDRWHDGGHLKPTCLGCAGCQRYWEAVGPDVSDTPELCNDRGPRVGAEGTMHCVLAKGHKGYHQGDLSWRQPGWPQWWSDQEAYAEQVTPEGGQPDTDDPDFCVVHGVAEPIPGYWGDRPPYIRCGECGHLYLTHAHLLDAFFDKCKAMGASTEGVTSAEDITYCQECTHNF